MSILISSCREETEIAARTSQEPVAEIEELDARGVGA